jgi:transcriptional regulator with XRE-family HTH domain
MVSRKLIEAVKLSDLKGYEIAHQAEIHPSTLSRILNGIEDVKPGDPRVLRIAKVLGLKLDECFEELEHGHPSHRNPSP